MKKSILLLLVALLLTGCTSTKGKKVQNAMIDLSEEIKEFASEVVSELPGDDYYLTEGIVAVKINSDSTLSEDSQTKAYPLYYQNQLTYLIIDGKEMVAIEVDDSFGDTLKDESAIVDVDGNIYIVNKNSSVLIYGEEKEENMVRIKKINDLQYILSLAESNKTPTPIKKEDIENKDIILIDGLEYSSSRMLVTFVEPVEDSYIEQFEQYCNGHLKSALKSVNVYVFTFEPMEAEQLKKLLAGANMLEYVQNAELDGVVHSFNGGSVSVAQ